MRFAPPSRLRIADRASGLNQVSVGSYNERLILSLLLQSDGLSRMEIGKKTGLSAQTVSVIVRSLEQEGLVAKGEARRGRVGPPTIPMSLNPEGALSLGVSVGNGTADIVLLDFVGAIRQHIPISKTEKPTDLNTQCLDAIEDAINNLPVKTRGRITGIGLALPDDLPKWTLSSTGSNKTNLGNLQTNIESQTGLQVFVQNDITAAAGGESMFGVAKPLSDYIFFFLGSELDSRLILNHQIHVGNASLRSDKADVGITNLQRLLTKQSLNPEALLDSKSWDKIDLALIKQWRQDCTQEMATQVRALAQFLDLDTVVLSSYAPERVRQELCQDMENRLTGIKAVTGDIAIAPKAVGAASLPFISRFMVSNIR